MTVVMLIGMAAIVVMGCTKPKPDPEPGSELSDWVDLDLPSGLLWATRNVGATSPEDYGDYFAWGETQTKEFYTWSNYRYSNGDYDQITKYCNNSAYGYNGFTDGLTTLQPGDDAATANYGGRTPTQAEWQELIDNTTSQWTTINGVNGRCLTGSNGNSLFLPASERFHSRDGRYWSSSLCTELTRYARRFSFFSDIQRVYSNGDRSDGYTVRAVRQK